MMHDAAVDVRGTVEGGTMSSDGGGVQPVREGVNPKLIVAGIIAILLIIFALQNAEDANISMLFWDVNVPVYVVIAIVALLGFVVGWLLGRGSGRRRAMRDLSD
jgi:uncharacterized integral membrane protein